jgi:ferric-dicitrate binding protein FerR (iron transport regulator)
MDAPDQASDQEDEIIAALADYHEGRGSAELRAQIEDKLANDPAWRAIDEEMRADTPGLAALGKVAAPAQFASHVTETIHRRSAGRFFGRRTLGDRLPVELLLAVAALLLGAVTIVWCRSTTGSLRAPVGTEEPRPVPTEPLVGKP